MADQVGVLKSVVDRIVAGTLKANAKQVERYIQDARTAGLDEGTIAKLCTVYGRLVLAEKKD